VNSALIVFAKAPVPGKVKTRLLCRLTPEEAAGLYKRFVRATLDIASECIGACASLNIRLFLACSPSVTHPFFREISEQYNIRLVEQRGRDLGERMMNALSDALAEGYRRVVIIGSDSPTLPADFIARGFVCLRDVDVVIGPAEDGGYYLIGAAGRVPPIFDGMRWSSSHVLDETIDRLRRNDISYDLLPVWYDIDTPEDIETHLLHTGKIEISSLPLEA